MLHEPLSTTTRPRFHTVDLVSALKQTEADECWQSKRVTKTTLDQVDDVRIKELKPLTPPQILMEDLPLSEAAGRTVLEGRRSAERIIKGEDDRLLVIVGPCSIHDVHAALEYAQKLRRYADTVEADLAIVMRVYFEKPRTTVGWKGLINDPMLNNTFQINRGLRVARSLLLDINELGLPAGVEFLDSISPQYIADTVSWGAIGARTTESQVHRELASGLSCPIGFKNGTEGSLSIAIDAIRASAAGHHFLGVTKQGISAIVSTEGNDCCHVILRGSSTGPNYSAHHVGRCCDELAAAGLLRAGVMVDCSHGNSQKKFQKQPLVARDLAAQISGGNGAEKGSKIFGVMIESNLVEGRQDIPPEGPAGLKYGQSVTDACINFETTVECLDLLAQAVRERRARMNSTKRQ